MRRLSLVFCLLAAAFPAAAYEEGAAVTNIHVDVANGTWPSVLVSPSVGFGLPYGFSLGARVETNGLVPFLYTDTKLWLAYEPFFERNSYDVGPGYSYPASGIRQRVGFALQGTTVDRVPVVVAGQYTNGVENKTKDGEAVLNQSFDVEQPTLTSDVFYGGAELRPFANAAGPFAVLGAGYLHSGRFIGDIRYTIEGKEDNRHIYNYVQWSVEPRVLLNVPGFAVAPGIGGSLVYQPFELLAVSAEAAVYYGNGLEFANDNIQKLTMAEFLFEATIPLAVDPASILAVVAPKPASPSPPPVTPAEPAEPAAPAADAAPTEPASPPAEAPAPSAL